MAAGARTHQPQFLSIVILHKFLNKILYKITTCIFPELWYNNYNKRKRGENTMLRIKGFVWFFVLNCCVNSLIKEPTDYWWLIEIIIAIISLIMVVDKKD